MPASAELGRAEDAVYRQVAGAFARAGRPVPERDAALDAAARDLARSAPPEGPGRARVAEALSRRGASDPSPRVFELRTTALDALAPALEGRADVTADPTTHVGVGAVDVGGEVVLIALLSQRKAVLDPFPRAFADAGATGTLCGALVPPLADPALYLTRPDGQVDQQRADAKHGARFCMRVRLPVRGRYVLQVLGTSRTGAEVAALFSVDVGAAPPSLDACCGEEPATLSAAREVLLARINTLRAAHRAGVLLPDRRLDGVAQAYAERMAREGFFAHVAPDGSRLRDRVSAAGLRPRVTGENLARADTSLAAQASLEASPGHRRNLLERQFTHAGLGVAFRTLPGGERQAVLVQVFAALPLPNAH